MRRYGQSTANNITIKGNDTGFSAFLSPVPAPAEAAPLPCEWFPDGLYFYNTESGDYDLTAEAGLLETYTDNVAITPDFTLTKPTYHWKAKLVGELCLCSDYTVEFVVSWSSIDSPAYYTSANEIFIFPRDDNKDESGVMTITAKLKDASDVVVYTSNEIYLVIASASYYYTISSGSNSTNIGGWLRVPDNFNYTSATGSMQWYGGLDGSIGAYSNNTLTLTFNNLPFTQLWVYSNDGGNGTYRVNGGASRYYNRGAFYPPWSGGTPIDIAGLSSIEINTDGYGAPVYIFGR